MRSLCPLLLSWAMALPSAHAAPSAESLKGDSLLDFSRTAQFSPKPFKAQRKVRVSGKVVLRGTAWVHDPNDSVVVANLHGSVSVSGENGRVRSGNVSVTKTATLHLNPGQSYVWVRVNFSQKVSLYCGGSPAGSAQLSGTIPLQGPLSGSQLILSGSQTVEGDVFVDCPAENPPTR